MDGFLQDVRYARRSLTKSRGFAAATVLTLALGIGANTAIFSVVSDVVPFDALAGYAVSARYLRGPTGSERVMTVAAEHGFFSMLGVAPIAGRTFQPDDPTTVAVVGEAFWKRRFDGDRSVIGRSVTFDGESSTIVGVMPQSFQFPYGAASLLADGDCRLPRPSPPRRTRRSDVHAPKRCRIEDSGDR
jgi:putative ABC transport system permease protein